MILFHCVETYARFYRVIDATRLSFTHTLCLCLEIAESHFFFFSFLCAALCILKAGLEEMMSFIKTEPSAAKLYASLEQPLKEFKQETESHLK